MRNPELHAAVLANPDDDAPRLVYADWLSERGSPRGELIALQIERAKIDSEDPRWLELYRLEWDLREAHEPIFKAPYGKAHVEYRRGFVESIHCLPSLTPKLDLTDAFVRHLGLYSELVTTEDLATLFGAPHLAHVERVVSYGLHLTNQHVPLFAKFARLELRAERLVVIDAILRRREPLHEIAIDHTELGRGGFVQYIGAPALARVDVLGLVFTGIGDVDVAAIIDSQLPITELRLSENAGITLASAERIANTPRFASLRKLTLASTSIGPEGFAALQASPYLPRSMELALDGTLLGLEIEYDFNDQGRAFDASWKAPPKSERFRISVEGWPSW